jgi:hypothetical protein
MKKNEVYKNLLELDGIKISFVLQNVKSQDLNGEEKNGSIWYGVIFEKENGEKYECIEENHIDFPIEKIEDLELYVNYVNKRLFKSINRLLQLNEKTDKWRKYR